MIREGEVYRNATESAQYLGITRFQFYHSIKSTLKRYKVAGCRLWLYRQSDLDAIKQRVEVIEPAA